MQEKTTTALYSTIKNGSDNKQTVNGKSQDSVHNILKPEWHPIMVVTAYTFAKTAILAKLSFF